MEKPSLLSLLRRSDAVRRAASQFLASDSLLSLAPGFSRVNDVPNASNGFSRLLALAEAKPLKRLWRPSVAGTGLKPGANERQQETEMPSV